MLLGYFLYKSGGIVQKGRGENLYLLVVLFLCSYPNDILGFRGVEKVGSIEVERDLFH